MVAIIRHFQVGDSQDFSDQEGGGAQDRRGKDSSDTSGSQQPAGRSLRCSLNACSSGQATDPSVTAVAAPLPDGSQQKRGQGHCSAGPGSALAHAPEGKIYKELAGAGSSRIAPKMVKRIMKVADTPRGMPKIPSRVMYMWPTIRSRS